MATDPSRNSGYPEEYGAPRRSAQQRIDRQEFGFTMENGPQRAARAAGSAAERSQRRSQAARQGQPRSAQSESQPRQRSTQAMPNRSQSGQARAQSASRPYSGGGSGGNGGQPPRGSSGSHSRRRKKRRRIQPRFAVLLVLLVAVVGVGVYLILGTGGGENGGQGGGGISLFASPTPTLAPTPEPTPEPTPTPKFDTPHAVDSTQPSNWGYTTALEVNGTQVESYTRETPMTFGVGEEYTAMEGVVTFRGNNYREGAAYGTASVGNKTLSVAWSVDTGEIMRGTSSNYSSTWTGSLWVGQPLIVKWPESTKRVMNMYQSAKDDPELVEVIYATASGRVYFLNLADGSATRDPLDLNMPFKGAGALDPRGYPILYLGSGDMYDDYPNMQTRAMAISLIDFSVLYEFGRAYDSFALRQWHAYDSSPLVNAETDTLIYPGENGIIYTVKLGTRYDEAAGTLSMSPSEVVKFRYDSSRSTRISTYSYESGQYKYWLGFESSVVTWGQYMYLSSNDGYVHCINLNTMETVWIQDIWDDANGTLVLEEDEANRTAYLYAGVSLHFTQDANATGITPFFKIDAVTGEILWHFDRKVHTKSGSSGGVQATAVLGRNSIENLVIIPFAKVYREDNPESADHGYLTAIDKRSGQEVWKQMTRFCWSSPLAIYDASGNAYIVQADSNGHIFLFDGVSGTKYYDLDTESKNFEASPAAYGNMIVIGNKDKKIFGIRIS